MNKNIYKPIPFWSWNGELEKEELIKQIDWMYDQGIGGFFMHARAGLGVEYLSEKWFDCVDACSKRAKELGMLPYAYDENGWPSGFVGGKLSKDPSRRDCYIEYSFGEYDPKAYACYDTSTNKLIRVFEGDNVLRVFVIRSEVNVDILNADNVKEFISLTHEQYRFHDNKNYIKGFFTDEPQFQSHGQPYTYCLEKYFLDKYSEDIKDKLGLLFVELEGYQEFRYRFWLAMNDLMVNSFAKQISDWCKTYGYKFTGHFFEETVMWLQIGMCGNIMPLYKYQDILGLDWLGREIQHSARANRMIASVLAQYNKKQALVETYAMTGWDCSPEELRRTAEYHYVTGINLLCYHLVPYSEIGQGKRDHPEHFSIHNPWVSSSFKDFNDYFTDLGEKLANSKEFVNVGVIYPIRSCYFNYKNQDAYNSIKDIEDSLTSTCETLNKLHIPFHILDETLLEEDGSVSFNKFNLNLMSYDVVILPRIYTLSNNTARLLKEYISNGGKVLLMDEKPTWKDGVPFEYDFLESNITLEEIKNSVPFDLSENRDLFITYRENELDGRKFFYVVNVGDETSATLNGKTLFFKRYESKFIYEDELKDDIKDTRKRIYLNDEFKLKGPVDNTFNIDCVSCSKDGVNYSKEMYCFAALNNLIKEKYKGDLYVKYKFNVKSVPNRLSVVVEDTNLLNLCINNIEIKDHSSVLEKHLWKFNLGGHIKQGINEIVIKLNYYQSNKLYHILSLPPTADALLHTLKYDSTIEPIYLVGDFGVYGDFKEGNEPLCYLGSNFYLDKQKLTVKSSILEGYPFFRGVFDVTQNIDLDDTNVVLSLPQRFQTIEVYVNSNFVKKIYCGHEVDISKFTKVGNNEIRLVSYSSNRNLLGPHHCKCAEEEKAVSVDSFEFKGTWKDDKSPNYRDSYSFVKNLF